MKDAVRNFWPLFTEPLEGSVNYMYADVKGLITTGVGNLIDPLPVAQTLPWVNPDGSLATAEEIATAWHAVQADAKAAKLGHLYAKSLTKLRLTSDSVSDLVIKKLEANDRELVRRFPDFEEWPADAQLATHSMAWACGSWFRFPKLAIALLEMDFETAANECHMNEDGNPGLAPRNRANKILYRNAARVVAYRIDPEALYYPTELDKVEPDKLPDLNPDSGEDESIHDPDTDPDPDCKS